MTSCYGLTWLRRCCAGIGFSGCSATPACTGCFFFGFVFALSRFRAFARIAAVDAGLDRLLPLHGGADRVGVGQLAVAAGNGSG
jgi:hypothetical protein